MAKTFYNQINTKFKKTYVTNRKNKKILNMNKSKIINWNKLKECEFDIIINTTPLGMVKHENFPFKLFNFKNCKTIIDVVAIPRITKLNIFAKKNNINFIGGHILSKYQAEKQFELYTNIKIK